jgi:predicted nucleic acid-binding protein
LITLDTSAILALMDRRDRDHVVVVGALRAQRPPFLVPAAVLGEIGSIIEMRLGQRVLAAFIDDLHEGSFSLDCGREDLGRVRELTGRYADLPLGLVDAAVIACAERNGGRTLTLDQRDFGIVARDVPLELWPALSG